MDKIEMRVDLDKLNKGNIREEIIYQLAVCDKIEDFSREELGQKADIILNLIEKRIDSIYPQNPIDTQYKTGYYNAICNVKELLKN